ncbi:MAG: HD domain-containing protein, partial [Actinomycetota bacterium]
MTGSSSPGEPGSAAVPEPPTASVTLADVQADAELSLFITSADRVMEGMGFTEHGFRHANLVASISYQVLHRLGYTDREADLACVAGYLHDVGNMLTREAHAQTGAVLVY